MCNWCVRYRIWQGHLAYHTPTVYHPGGHYFKILDDHPSYHPGYGLYHTP